MGLFWSSNYRNDFFKKKKKKGLLGWELFAASPFTEFFLGALGNIRIEDYLTSVASV